jgi:hypothetical protein
MVRRERQMATDLDLKQLERKAFRSTFQDGLWDIFLGLLLLNMGGGTLLGGSGMSPLWSMVVLTVFAGLVLLVFWAGKKYITTPRIGSVEFGPQRKSKLKRVRAVLFLSVLMGVLTFLWGWAAWSGRLPYLLAELPIPAYVWAVQCLAVFSVAAYFMDVTRFYLYGVLYALPFPLGILLARNTDLSGIHSMALTFGSAGGIMVVIGVLLFIRFVRRHPKPAEDGLERNAGSSGV